jgi:hypothetical protein
MVKVIPIGKGKIAFQVLLIILFQWTTIAYQFNLYHTDQRFKSHSFQFDCLNYYIRRENLAYQDVSDVIDDVIPYCFRPATDFHDSAEAFVDPPSQKLSFEELRMTNINALQLLSWSIAIEVVERYQLYLNKPDSALNEQIYNCTPPRFGLKCQYSFEFGKGMSFNQIVETTFHGRVAYSESSDMIVEVPCYVLLECHRNGQPWCLDWREVCDGNVDCFDEELDEKYCFDMEINECSDDEYRCHNGLCISKEFWEDGIGDTDCLDRSDRTIDIPYVKSCFQDPTFRCEEHSCEIDNNQFSCGDGQCVPKFENCPNGRHALLIESITTKGDLEDECWITMICLTKIVKIINKTSCEVWLMNNSTVYTALEKCGSFFQFPTVPIHSHHVRFFYQDPHLRSIKNQVLMPDYFCYDPHLCDSFIPALVPGNQTCFNATEFVSKLNFIRGTWWEVMWYVGYYFRVCSVSCDNFHKISNYDDYPSLYKCQNSLKMISKHRIMDIWPDCPEKDDENYRNSCQLHDRYRVTCLDTTKCWSPLARSQACALNHVSDPQKIRFQSFCDGIEISYRDSKGQEYSDEFGCGDWSCSNIYTRCDGFWTCDDGRDENNCGKTICPSGKFACVSPVNYTVLCLNSSYVNNDIVECLGALDEQVDCRRTYNNPLENTYNRFRCSEEGLCLQVSQLCNNEKDCLKGADDEDFCENQQLKCDQNSPNNRSNMEIFCELNEEGNRSSKYFAVHTCSNYPSLKTSLVSESIHRPEDQHSPGDVKPSQFQNNTWPWYCNRGLIVYDWIQNNNRTCMCPPSYYGDLCQYQNQRISLTIQLNSNDRYATYAAVSMLIDDNDEQQQIYAFDRYVYIAKESCSIKLNRYLLFPTRPKDTSKNYIVRIDIFEKNALTYIGSWHFPIAFLFLPVNRLSIALNLSNHVLQRSFNCSNNCMNGEYIRYVNKEKYFCRCFPAWSGIQCNISINFTTCSANSISIGSVNNRSICVCPIDQFGPRCLLTSKCPVDACQNNGQCVPADVTIPGNSYTCLCSDRFFGSNCEYRKATLDVSLENIHIPSYLVAYFFTLSNKSDPIETIVLRKLTLFQHIVTFYLAAPFQLTFIQVDNKYYLALLQQYPKTYISTLINPKQECISIGQLLNSTILALFEYQRIIHFHMLCQSNFNLMCFIDKDYLCLCTNEHHANCLKFKQQRNFDCSSNNYCENNGKCLQDHPTCPSTKICLCPSCFFGNRCQFYAKGLGSTLDEILGYEFKRNTVLFKQPMRVQVAATITMVLFLIGFISSILSIITFSRPKSHEVGCGIYLLGSSITSLFTTTALLFKFWFLFHSHQNSISRRNILEGNCFGIEPLLKIFLYTDTWLNACVAIERTITVIQGPRFNKQRSRKIAFWIIAILTMTIIGLLMPQLIYLHIFDDQMEERSWCVVTYVKWLATYSSTLIFIHYFGPLGINMFSILCIMIITARRRAKSQKDRNFWVHLRSRIKINKHILISSTIIICLTLPHLIISIILDCQKSSNLFWFYLLGYFLSFCPATFVFTIFVLPTQLYRQEFYEFIADIRKRFKTRNMRDLPRSRHRLTGPAPNRRKIPELESRF